MNTLHFVFFRLLEEVEITPALRVSIWLEENEVYLMPSRMIEVLADGDLYKIRLEALDPDGWMSEKWMDQKFLFGHPGKIIGYGILKEIEKHV